MPGDAPKGLEPPVYIDSATALAKLVGALRKERTIAVDTESNPLFAYRERLCLVQVSTRSRDYIIDPLAGVDLAALVPVFADPDIVKVFHDAEFDVLMLKRTLPVEFAGIFDTKVVASALGLATVGLAPILESFFGVVLDKRLQRSDWGRRPLTEAQLDYACYDTHFLIPLAADLRARLESADEIDQLEVAAEFQRVEQLVPEAREFDPDDFTRIKGWERLDGVRRRVLRELFVMRHGLADKLDRPAFKILPNDTLLALAEASPRDAAELARDRLLPAKLRERYGAEVLAAVADGRRGPPLDGAATRPRNQDQLADDQRVVYEALRTWRKKVADQRGADASLVLPRATMFALARLQPRPRDLPALRASGILQPWRVDYYGEGILAALQAGADNGARGRHRRRRP